MIVYITGCLGFIGYYVASKCLAKGWHVRGIDKITYAANPELLKQLNIFDKFKFEQKDINDLKYLYDCDYIINCAAETHVDNSIVKNDEFLHSNINGAHNILELIRSKSHFKMPTLIHFSCYDEKTKVLTRQGLREYYQVKVGDEVLSINTVTKNTEFKKILKVIIQDYDGEMVHFKHKSDDLMVTPNHRMYFLKNKKIQIGEAKSICDKHGQTYLRGNKSGKESDINIEGLGLLPSKEVFYLSGIFIGDGFLANQVKLTRNKSGLKREDYLSKCRSNLGQFKKLSHIGDNEYSKSECYRIYFDVPEKDKARKKLEKTLNVLKINWYPEKNSSEEHIYFSSKEWSNYFSQFGQYAENKTIPDWMFDYDHSILRELYNGIIDSDGYRNNSGTGILTTTSYSLVQKCCILGYSLNFYMKFSSYKQPNNLPQFKDGREIKSRKKSYQVFFNTQNIGCGNEKYHIDNYKGKIWCLTVEDNKNLIVERNGLLKISGNTDEVYGDSSGTHTEKSVLNPSNPYSSTKAAADMLILAWARTYKIPYVIVRPSNNYGIGQYVEKLIPKACKFLSLGRKIPLHDGGTPMRTWLHASDTAEAILTIIEKGRANEIFNIAGDYEDSNLNIITKILRVYYDSKNINILNYIDLNYRRLGHDIRYQIDDSKLRKLGWKPKTDFDKVLPNIISYYKENFIW
jgi:dTDP-D-glucose 4,6-dehydratase